MFVRRVPALVRNIETFDVSVLTTLAEPRRIRCVPFCSVATVARNESYGRRRLSEPRASEDSRPCRNRRQEYAADDQSRAGKCLPRSRRECAGVRCATSAIAPRERGWDRYAPSSPAATDWLCFPSSTYAPWITPINRSTPAPANTISSPCIGKT